MSQPSFVPIADVDQVRPARRLTVPKGWSTDRPAELPGPSRPITKSFGTPGPDQGFVLHLAKRFEERLVLTEGEVAEDAMLGCALLASRRAGLFGRAPSIHDLNVAFAMFGFLAAAPAPLVKARHDLFQSASHDYVVQRRLVDAVPEEALRRSPAEIADIAVADRLAMISVSLGEH